MTISKFSRGTSSGPFHLPARFLSSIGVFLFVVLPIMSYAQQAAPSGEDVYFNHLGCWNCHGKPGDEGGIGPVIAKTRLPLRKFVGYMRLPSNMMPPYSSRWASDAELAIVYHWLDGIEAVKTPPAVAVDLKSSPGVKADGLANAEVEIEMTAPRAETALKSAVPDLASLRYRVTMITNAKAPVANQTLEYRPAGREQWSKVTTDEHGEVLLGQDVGFIEADAKKTGTARARLRVALPPAGRTVLVVEPLDYTEPAKLVVMGIGTAILKGQ